MSGSEHASASGGHLEDAEVKAQDDQHQEEGEHQDPPRGVSSLVVHRALLGVLFKQAKDISRRRDLHRIARVGLDGQRE
jgi:hypothetical protein